MLHRKEFFFCFSIAFVSLLSTEGLYGSYRYQPRYSTADMNLHLSFRITAVQGPPHTESWPIRRNIPDLTISRYQWMYDMSSRNFLCPPEVFVGCLISPNTQFSPNCSVSFSRVRYQFHHLRRRSVSIPVLSHTPRTPCLVIRIQLAHRHTSQNPKNIEHSHWKNY